MSQTTTYFLSQEGSSLLPVICYCLQANNHL